MMTTTGWPRRLRRERAFSPAPMKVNSGARLMTAASEPAARSRARSVIRAERMWRGSNFHDVGFLRRERLVDLLHEAVGQFLDFLFVAGEIVLGDLAVLLAFFQAIDPIAPGRAHAHPRFLGHLL